MYEKLVEALRLCVKYDNAMDALINAEKAADAIEELQAGKKKFLRNISALETENENLKRARRWIPVTERLPDAEPGDVSERVLVTDGKDVAIVEWFNFEEYEPFWGYTGFGKDVTHWMPLPEPPKEET